MNAGITATDPSPGRVGPTPIWLFGATGFGALWNAFGLLQLFHTVTSTRESLVAMGMTDAQAQVMTQYPVWMTLGFAVGAAGGLLGSALLFMRRKLATPVLIASLAGYIVLYIGDISEGVFAAIGIGQIVVLSVVVAIACGLLWASSRARRLGILT